MCLIALAIGQHPRFPLVVAANRDEFFARPAAALDWWTPPHAQAAILAGRDLDAGGTWMGLTRSGRIAMLTNVREPARRDAAAPSRGDIVPAWLTGTASMDRFWASQDWSRYNGFNLIAADVANGEWFCASNRGARMQRLEPGLYGLSNAWLDTPWPKVRDLKQLVQQALSASQTSEALAHRLLDALADRRPAPEHELPRTGIEPGWEQALSAAFIHSAERGYGTRCSTLVVTEKPDDGPPVTHVFERSFTALGQPQSLRRMALAGWPSPADC